MFSGQSLSTTQSSVTGAPGLDKTAHGTDAFVGIIELAALSDAYQEEEHVVTVEELNRMTIEITLGWSWQDPRTDIHDTPEHHAKWKRLETQIADIKQRGRIVHIPNEWPDLGDLEPNSNP